MGTAESERKMCKSEFEDLHIFCMKNVDNDKEKQYNNYKNNYLHKISVSY